MNINKLAQSIESGEILTPSRTLEILNASDNNTLELLTEAYKLRSAYFGNRMSIQLLNNAKSGNCSENCQYCAQSSISEAPIESYPLHSPGEILEKSRVAREIKARRYCVALSGRIVTDAEIDKLCETYRRI